MSSLSISSESTDEVQCVRFSSIRLWPNKVGSTIPRALGLKFGSVLRGWNDISTVNFVTFDTGPSVQDIWRQRSKARFPSDNPADFTSYNNFPSTAAEYVLEEKFPKHITSLMNEDNYWGCFYILPELYEDVYSPVIQVLDIADVPDLVNGALTHSMVNACLTYLKRNPILGDYVFIKLDLSFKLLSSIDVLQNYKYLVYLDLSSNRLTELTVLSYLLYLQFLNVAYNRLSTVLEYDTPQWFLSEVHYKYNSVKRISDLNMFWSITILDLSHNNIKAISGLESLRYLRRLDLSFNHIQRIENLDHLRLLWLDLSYNNISSFNFGPDSGLWTLLHLEYLNLNENRLTSMKIFLYCTRLQELYARNNRLNVLLELAVYMANMRRLVVLDLRENPICVTPGYKDVVLNTFPRLLNLDGVELDPVEVRSLKMDMKPDITTFATRRLLRLLYIQQLSRSVVSPYIPPADTTDVPIIVLVGQEAEGKGSLARRLAKECSSNVTLAYQHTTATHHLGNHYREITRTKFDDMLLAGEFLTYAELDGESYGLSREEAFVEDGKIRIVSMDLVSALMLRLRGYRPYLILTTNQDKVSLVKRQQLRKMLRIKSYKKRESYCERPAEQSTLQVLLSGRIIITGILNEILLAVPEEKTKSEFTIASECSLMADSEMRRNTIKAYAQSNNLLAILSNSTQNSSLDNLLDKRHIDHKTSKMDTSLCSLYKESQGSCNKSVDVQNVPNASLPDKNRKISSRTKISNVSQSQRNTVDFTRYTSSTWKGSAVAGGSKSSKSVNFPIDDVDLTDTLGLMIEPKISQDEQHFVPKSISARERTTRVSHEDSELWLAFLIEAGMLKSANLVPSETRQAVTPRPSNDDSILHEMNLNSPLPETIAMKSKNEDYDEIHRECPGMFWDTVNLDNPDKAFLKVRDIIREIMKTQSKLQPMFDIDFAHLENYPTVESRLQKIRKEIAPHQIFF